MIFKSNYIIAAYNMSSFTINFYQILIIAKLSQSNKSIPSDLNVILYYKFECGAGYVVRAHKK